MNAARRHSHGPQFLDFAQQHDSYDRRGRASRERALGGFARSLLTGFLLLFLAGVPALAQEQAAVGYNVVITDEATGFLASCSQVRIYIVDPVDNIRLVADPIAQLPNAEYPMYPAPANPILLELLPGRYEMTVCVSWLPAEVHYMFFNVANEGISMVDVLTVELPMELMTY